MMRLYAVVHHDELFFLAKGRRPNWDMPKHKLLLVLDPTNDAPLLLLLSSLCRTAFEEAQALAIAVSRAPPWVDALPRPPLVKSKYSGVRALR
jgi:hypothetical protein